jgi:hypothetical protein
MEMLKSWSSNEVESGEQASKVKGQSKVKGVKGVKPSKVSNRTLAQFGRFQTTALSASRT